MYLITDLFTKVLKGNVRGPLVLVTFTSFLLIDMK